MNLIPGQTYWWHAGGNKCFGVVKALTVRRFTLILQRSVISKGYTGNVQYIQERFIPTGKIINLFYLGE